MNNNGFTGVSFPFRLNARGGIKMSTTSPVDFSHIEESIHQILRTNIGERIMELQFGSMLSTHIFDTSDDSSSSLIKYEIVEALHQYEPRIEISTEDIEIVPDSSTEENKLYITIQYKVIKYNKDSITNVIIGG